MLKKSIDIKNCVDHVTVKNKLSLIKDDNIIKLGFRFKLAFPSKLNDENYGTMGGGGGFLTICNIKGLSPSPTLYCSYS